MFYIVQLVSDILKEKIVVPSLWLDRDNTLCLLPNIRDPAEIERLAKTKALPRHGWQMHDVSFIQLKSFDTYTEAKKNITQRRNKPMLIRLEDKDVDGKGGRVQRKRKRPSFLENYAIETDSYDAEIKAVLEDDWSMEGNISHPDPSIVKTEKLDDTMLCEYQKQSTTDNKTSINSNFSQADHRRSVEKNLSTASLPVNGMNTRCACNSLCHSMFLQSLAAMQRQLEDSNRMLYQITGQLMASGHNFNVPPSEPAEFPIELPITELAGLQSFDAYLCNERNFAEAIPHFSGLGGSYPRQVLKRIMDTLMAKSLSATLNWKGRGDKDPFNVYTQIHRLVHHVAQLNSNTLHITLKETENIIKEWLKVPPPKKPTKNSPKKNATAEGEKILRC